MDFGTKKSVVATPSFSERMASIKSMFKTAHENASNLHAEMESEIAKKESQIAALQEDIKTIGVTKQEAETFMSSLFDMIEQINQLKQGSIISESSHYIVNRVSGSNAWLTHFESGEEVQIGMSYLKNYTNSADLFETTVKVTKEDKKDGTLGIRSIWENIHSGQVFTVCFKKQDKPKSKRKLQEEIDAIVEQFSNSIDTVKNNKKGVANAAKNLITELVNNPVLPYEEGEDRVLRGYKIQFESRDGRYDCVDMDITKTDKESGIRPVNINTIKWLIFNGVKYIVE